MPTKLGDFTIDISSAQPEIGDSDHAAPESVDLQMVLFSAPLHITLALHV